jgi:hypothetical protein
VTGRSYPRVLFAGSQTWTDREPVKRRIAAVPAESLVIVGGAPGADTIAEEEAKARGDLYVARIDALWGHLRKRAGHARNGVMVDLLDSDRDWMEAFWDGVSPGTAGCIARAEALRVPYYVWFADGRSEQRKPWRARAEALW